jgi:hypothetical protein
VSVIVRAVAIRAFLCAAVASIVRPSFPVEKLGTGSLPSLTELLRRMAFLPQFNIGRMGDRLETN